MKCKQCGKEMAIDVKFGITEFVCECGYETDEMAVLNDELQYLRKLKEEYIDSDKALLIAQAQVQFANQMTDFAKNLIIGQAMSFANKKVENEKIDDDFPAFIITQDSSQEYISRELETLLINYGDIK